MKVIRLAFAALAATGVVGQLCFLTGSSAAIAWIAGPVLGLLVLLCKAPVAQVNKTPRWLLLTGVALIAVITGAIAWGSISTPARHWDGFASWELRADVLATSPTLEQPFFADQKVFSPSRDYPLLQPLCLAGCKTLLGDHWGRLWFAALFLLFVAVIWTTAQRLGGASNAALIALGAALLPMLIAPTGGSADSGYGELLLLTCLTAAGSGLLLGDRLLMFVACVVLCLSKPEGPLYGAVLLTSAFCRRDGLAAARFALAGLTVGMLTMLPVQQVLANPNGGGSLWLTPLILVAVAILALGIDELSKRCNWSTRLRLLVCLILAPALIVTLPILAGDLLNENSAVGTYLQDARRAVERLSRVGAILLGEARYALHPRRFGMLFWLIIPATVLAWQHRKTAAPRTHTAILTTWLGLASITVAFLLSPESNLDHHLKSSMDRLLLHWTGVAWLGVAAVLGQLPPASTSDPRHPNQP